MVERAGSTGKGDYTWTHQYHESGSETFRDLMLHAKVRLTKQKIKFKIRRYRGQGTAYLFSSTLEIKRS